MALLICSFFWLTTSLPRSTHWLTVSRASRPRFFRYSVPSCAVFLIASRVSRPERGAYSTPIRAPKPRPARNHRKLLLPSLSDIRQPPQVSDVITRPLCNTNLRKGTGRDWLSWLGAARFTTSLHNGASYFTQQHHESW